MLANRVELARYFADLGFQKGAEIGVYYGYYSKVLLDTIPNLNLLSIDPWHRQKVHAKLYPQVIESLKGYVGSTILRGFSLDVARIATDQSLDFVYIDADHSYESIKADIEAWAPKVRVGGIISGHDYYHFKYSGNKGVVEAVDEYVANNNLKLQLTEWNHSSHKDDRQPSWWVIKE